MRLSYEEMQEISGCLETIIVSPYSALAKLANYLRETHEAIQIYPESTVARSYVSTQQTDGYNVSDLQDV